MARFETVIGLKSSVAAIGILLTGAPLFTAPAHAQSTAAGESAQEQPQSSSQPQPSVPATVTSPQQPQQSSSVAPPPPRNSGASNPEAIVVTGRSSVAGGLMKVQTAAETMSSITSAAIQEKVAASSPLQLVATLPGVNYGNSDAYGLSVRNFISVRGLDQTELGFQVENIPGTDYFAYFPYTESWADNENIADITLTPGNSRLQDPIISASGGEFIMTLRDPTDELGGMLTASAGSHKALRGFIDLDTGKIGNTGAKAFLSYSYTKADNFFGPGTNRRAHIDFKAVEDWSSTAHSSLWVSYNRWINDRLPFFTLAQANNGISTGNLEQYAYAATYTPGVLSPNYYKTIRSPRRDIKVASNNDVTVGNNVTLRVTPYYVFTHADATGETALAPTSVHAGNQLVTAAYDPATLQGGKLFLQNNNWFREVHLGVNNTIEADLGPHNHLVAGYWYEHYHVDDDSFYNQLDTHGNAGLTLATALRSTTGVLVTGTNFAAHTDTNEFYIGDTQSLLDDRLKISVGFKELFWGVSGTNYVVGTPPTFSKHWHEALPRVLVSYDLSPRMQVYANVTTNARMPVVPSTYVLDYNSATGGISQAANPSQKPEYSIDSQIGYRFHGPIILDASAFYMHLLDHQLATTQNVNGTLVPTAFTIGNETIRGASLEISTRSYHGFSAYGSAQYLDATFDDDTPLAGDFLPTRDKHMVESPRWTASFGGRYDRGPIFVAVDGKYVADQYATLMNDQVMPHYTTFDLSAGYRFPDFGRVTKPEIRLAITNIGNKPYIGSIAAIATNAVTTVGRNGKVFGPGTPLYYLSAPITVMATLSAHF